MTWETRDGRLIKVSELTDTHAKNIINFIIKQNSPQAVLEAILSSIEQAKKGSVEERLIEEGMNREFEEMHADMTGQDYYDQIDTYTDYLRYKGE